MRIFSKIFFWLGVIGIVAAIIIGFQPGWNVYLQYATLSTGRSLEFTNPLVQLSLAIVVLLLGGFFMGLGVGMIRRKPKVDQAAPRPEPAAPEPPTADPPPLL